MSQRHWDLVSILSPLHPPRRDRPTRQISDFSPNSPDHALRFTAIRASERFRGRVALPALSGPLPRTAAPKARALNPRHDAPRGPPGPRRQSTKRPASTSRRALNSPSWTRTSNLAVNSRPLYRLSYRGMLGREGNSIESPRALQPSGIRAGSLSRGAENRPVPRLRAASPAARSASGRPGAGAGARGSSPCRRRSGGSRAAGSAPAGSRSPCC